VRTISLSFPPPSVQLPLPEQEGGMSSSNEDKTGVFDLRNLSGVRCPDCGGTGQLRIDSENITETFEVEKQTVITECPRCAGTGFVSGS
jgi:DnaJ-class molecular chaperone